MVKIDPVIQAWTGPFIVGPVNARVVRRTNALLGSRYGKDFRYREAVRYGRGPKGWLKAQTVTQTLGLYMLTDLSPAWRLPAS